jgi:hypothetical protein
MPFCGCGTFTVRHESPWSPWSIILASGGGGAASTPTTRAPAPPTAACVGSRGTATPFGQSNKGRLVLHRVLSDVEHPANEMYGNILQVTSPVFHARGPPRHDMTAQANALLLRGDIALK